MLDKTGDATPPCGAPERVAFHCQSSRYPARSMFLISRRNLLSWIFSARILAITSWSKDPKQSEISPSINQVVPVQVSATSVSAVWQQIGRASCRERVKISVVDGSVR